MPRSWSADEDRSLLQWVTNCRKIGMTRKQTFEMVAEKLNRSENACYARWKKIVKRVRDVESSGSPRHKKGAEMEKEPQSIRNRMDELEQITRTNHDQLDRLLKENRKLREEMKFFEQLLMEEYQLLVHLLSNKNRNARIHQLESRNSGEA
ncbi:hypothetical protein [Paludifilum halophilum]|uniref:Myb-like domain-containing protein n=1 Tax=Paludifilum halophilum TaxID=1642702 RepID=A0A235B9N8_9BACL|nr:hypothetical protein [Paludifilum halophilum]OYD09020.1 hypothetical protein CHM34_04400 [Paludifilum halophilum]